MSAVDVLPVEEQGEEARANECREVVAAQLMEEIIGSGITGSTPYVLRRLAAFREANAAGDLRSIRAAAFDLAAASAACVVAIDMHLPKEPTRRRRRV